MGQHSVLQPKDREGGAEQRLVGAVGAQKLPVFIVAPEINVVSAAQELLKERQCFLQFHTEFPLFIQYNTKKELFP